VTNQPLRTTAEVAALIGRSPETVRRWRRNGYIQPAAEDQLTDEALWSPENITAMRLFVVASRADRVQRLRKYWRRP
jgi:predicted site-specific integrase-resolvase